MSDRQPAAADERPLPHSDEAEQSVLGAILIDNAQLDRARELLSAGDFYSLRHAAIFRALSEMAESGHPLDVVTLKYHLAGKLDECGGPAYLAGLMAGVPRAANAERYARIVHHQARRRRIIRDAKRLSDAAWNGTADVDLVEDVRKTAKQWGEIEPDGAPVTFETGDAILARPVPAIDWIADGLIGPSDVVIVSGAAGVGKSWIAIHILCAVAAGSPIFGAYQVSRPRRVALLDLEDSSASIDGRLRRVAAALALDAEAAGRVLVLRERLRLDSPSAVAKLLRFVGQERIELLAVDTLRRASAGDENASDWSSSLFRDALDPLRAAGCTVLLSAHVRKLSGVPALDDPAQALRGSSDLLAMVDLHIGVEKRADGLAWIPTKLRHARLAEPLLLELCGLDGDDDQPVAVTCRRGLDRASDAVQDAVVTLLGTDELPRGEILGKLPQFSHRAIDGALSALKRRGIASRRMVGRQAAFRLSIATLADACNIPEDVP